MSCRAEAMPPVPPPAPTKTLAELYQDDQADRSKSPVDWQEVEPRDRARREAAAAILAAGGAHSARDYFHAAMIFQHGHEVQDFRRAHTLALQAAELDPTLTQARWLAAASKDRELMNLGKPQLYGTQSRTNRQGVWELYPVDPTVTDEERSRWQVPPLSEARARIDSMNQRN